MAFRSDVSIDWMASPRIITVAAPSVTITIQDLSTTLRTLEDRITSMFAPKILDNEGKFDLYQGTKFTGISLRLLNAKLAFEARAGPTWAECTVTGGNLTAVDDVDVYFWPIEFTAFTSVVYESDTSAALIEGSGCGEAPAMMVKVKDAGGTVRTGMIPVAE